MIITLNEKSENGFEWIDITNPEKVELSEMASKYKLHKALVEDSLQPEHLPKYEMIDDIQFLILRVYSVNSFDRADTTQELTDKIAVFIGTEFIITIHRLEYGFLSEIKNKFVDSGKCSSSYDVLHRIIFKALGTYDQPLGKLHSEIESYEPQVFLTNKVPSLLENLYFLKRKAYVMGRIFNLSKTILDNLSSKLPPPELNNLRDTLLSLLTQSDQIIDNAQTLLNTYISLTSQRTNEVMRVLTVFSVFFMPLTFIVGIYGMNFDFMPELNWRMGYFSVLIFMAFVTMIIYVWFKRKGWL